MGSRVGHSVVTLDGRCVVTVAGGFQGADRAGKLKIWETEKLIVCTPCPDCQDFRFSLPHLPYPEFCRLNPDGGMGRGMS